VRSPYTRSDWYVGFRLAPGVDNLFSMRDDKLHAKRRSQMNKGYTGKENVGLEASIDKHVRNLVLLIRRKYISSPSCTRPMDLSRKAQYFTIDMITDVAFGASFGDLEQDEDMHEYLQRTENSLPVMVMIGTVPSLKDWLQHPWIGRWIYPSATAEKGIGKLIGSVFPLFLLLSPENVLILLQNRKEIGWGKV
jgi:cytochrome P450